jgi:hypothetical protein
MGSLEIKMYVSAYVQAYYLFPLDHGRRLIAWVDWNT